MLDIAITGIGCRFPGGVRNPEEYWDFLLSKGDGMVEVPADRWSLDRYYSEDPDAPGRMYTRRGGFLEDPLWDFDPEFFGISPREASIMDPQQRLLLEVAVEALDDAGMSPRVAGRSVGVYVGGFTNDNSIGRHVGPARARINSHTATSSTFTMLSNRISYVLDLVGPSMTIDTACSSSLVAVHEAAASIARGESVLALAGGVNVMLQPETFVSMCKGRFLARDGRSKSFDASADGYGRGEGAGIVVLKPLADARADGDRVYAVIRATGANQDGRTSGITVPNPVSQAALAARVLSQSGLVGDQIGYVEAHGTGTPIGDPLEVAALGEVYGRSTGRGDHLVVGSVKAGIGHLEAAAGIAGVIKAALSVHHGTVAPQAWLDELNPAIPFDDLGIRIAERTEPLPRSGDAAHVAVNGFGYGGTNAHLIMSEEGAVPLAPGPAPVTSRDGGTDRPGLNLFPVSGRTEEAVRVAAGRLADLVDGAGPQAAVQDVCDAAWTRRTHHPYRVAIPFTDQSDLLAGLQELAGEGGRPVTRTVGREGSRPVFVFSGMGPQWWKMGRGLLAAGGTFAKVAQEIDDRFVLLTGWSILGELAADEESSRVSATEVAQPANFLVQVALVAELADLGITPSAIVGHSVGEVSAAYVSGALTLDDALLVSYHRSRLQALTAGTGGMLAVGVAEAEVEGWLDGGSTVCVAAVNSPSSVTVAGPHDELRVLADRLTEGGVFARALKVEVPYHSALMDPILDDIRTVLASLRPTAASVPLYSTVTAGPVDGSTWDASYWVDNVRQPVRFADAVTTMVDDGHQIFLEIGPHPALSGNIKEILVRTSTAGAAVSTLHRKIDDVAACHQAVAELYQVGCVDTSRRPGAHRVPVGHVDLPAYPWQRTRLWSEVPQLADALRGVAGARPMLGQPSTEPGRHWEVELSAEVFPWLADHVVDGVVVLPGAAYLDAALSAAAEVTDRNCLSLGSVRFTAPLVIAEHDIPVLRVSVDEATKRFRIHGRTATEATWTLHASGTIVDASHQPGRRVIAADPDAEVVDGPDLYAQLAARGLRYGPSFQRVTSARRAHGEVVGQIDASPFLAAGHVAHPTVVDSALQCVAVAFAFAGHGDAAPVGPVIPTAISDVRRFAELPARLTVIVRRRPGRVLRADVVLIDEDGSEVMELAGVEFRPVRGAEHPAGQLADWWYEPTWEVRPARPADRAGTAFAGERRVVVALEADPGPLARSLAEALPGAVLVAIDGASGGVVAAVADVQAGIALALADPEISRVAVVVVGGTDDVAGAEEAALGLVVAARAIAGATEEDAGGRVTAVAVTRNALGLEGDPATNLGHAAMVGARRTLRNEQPDVAWRLVDIDEGTSATTVHLELASGGAFADDDADEVALRDGVRLVMKMEKTLHSRVELLDVAEPLTDPEQSFRVEVPRSALFADLALRAVERVAPAENEIEVRMISAGLNYKDSLKVVGVLTDRELEGTYFGTQLGMECLATVVRTGPGVERFTVGQRLFVAARDSMARYLTVNIDEGAIWPAPDVWSDVGCSSGLPFVTADYALVDRARVEPGETVLVHGAAGGVGMATVQVARLLGARVIGTASTPERRAELLAAGADHALDSRSLNFVQEVRDLTDGRGADVIVNSAPGAVLRANLHAAAEFGRIVEVGKADIYTDGMIDLAPFDRNLSFMAIDMDRMLAVKRPLTMRLIEQTVKGFEDGSLRELPTTTYPLSDLRGAYEAVARGGHVGRVAISFDDEAPAVRPAPPRCAIRADATYLVTGGYGAFGLATGRWLVSKGARRLVLVGRRGLNATAAIEQVRIWEDAGIEVVTARADVADPSQVDTLVRSVHLAEAPLAGVFHAAGVLEDEPFAALTEDSLHHVLAPKAQGAWNLHGAVLAAGITLDHFVLYSSVTALVGTVPQLAYAAANSVLDAIASHRRTLGLSATSVNWGVLSGGGMAEGSEIIERYLATLGLRPIDMDVAAAALDTCLAHAVPRVGLVDLDWARWAATHPASAAAPRVAAQVAAASEGTDSGALRSSLLALPEEQRVEVVAYMLAEQLATVLGIPAEAIELTTPLPDLGLDSLMAVELVARINLTFGLEVSALELIRGVGLAGIATTLLPALAGAPTGERV